MTMVDLEVSLTEDERVVRDTARRFALETLRPVGTLLDRQPDPAEVIAPQSPLWHVFDRYRELGLGVLEEIDPASDRSLLERARLRFLIAEELGWGDAGLAISLGVSRFHRFFAQLTGRQALIERFCRADDRSIGCWAITEPDHGSDELVVADGSLGEAARNPNCVARRDGDHWVIDGQKAAWVSNGTIANVATLFCTLDPSQGLRAGGVALVPLDVPGVSRGKPLDKLGQRALNQGEIFFDGVRIPEEYMVVGPEAYANVLELVLAMANASMGAIFVGCARAALDHALAYTKERIQGGVPVFRHQSVKSRLFRMFMQVEAARALAWRALLYNSCNPPLLQYSIASKVFSTTTAFEVASMAVQLLGGNGLSREYPTEKLLRDARASMIEDGCNEVLGIMAAGRL